MSNETPTSVFIIFMEAAVHSILYVTRVYPKGLRYENTLLIFLTILSGLFDRTRCFGVSVMKSRSTLLRNYVKDAIESLVPLIKQGEMEKFVLETYITQDASLLGERFVFELGDLLLDDNELIGLKASLGSFLVKIMNYSSKPYKVSTWKLKLETSKPQIDSIESFLWVDDIDTMQNNGDQKIFALRSQQNEQLKMQLYVVAASSNNV